MIIRIHPAAICARNFVSELCKQTKDYCLVDLLWHRFKFCKIQNDQVQNYTYIWTPLCNSCFMNKINESHFFVPSINIKYNKVEKWISKIKYSRQKKSLAMSTCKLQPTNAKLVAHKLMFWLVITPFTRQPG